MNRLQANLCLVCVTLCWSTEVIIFACIPDSILPFATTVITSGIAALILFACFFKRIRQETAKSGKKLLLRCLLLGILKTAYDILFLYGLNYFDVSTGAFTFSITVVVLPVILLTMKKKVNKKTWVSVILVLIGIVCALGSSLYNTQIPGLLSMFVGCTVRAFFIVKLNEYAKEHDPVTISAWISVIVTAIAFGIWVAVQPTTFASIPWSGVVVASLFIYAYFIVAFAQTLNIFAQKRATATGATIIYSLEIVFSLIWSYTLPEALIDRAEPSPFHVVGALFIVAGSLIEILEFRSGRGRNEIRA